MLKDAFDIFIENRIDIIIKLLKDKLPSIIFEVIDTK